MPNKHSSMTSLANQFLVAMPALDDSYFGRSVIYICEHDDEGAMGLVINKSTEIAVNTVLLEMHITDEELDTEATVELDDINVMSGGPVHTDRGFILHNGDKKWSSSLKLDDQINVTTSKDILENLATKAGPEKYLMTLGYAGWTAGQLEQELADNTWLTIDADPDLIFDTPIEDRWEKAVQKLGINVEQLTAFSGHA
jgi:putative transcriptional regulator